jgi:hypothetical protein
VHLFSVSQVQNPVAENTQGAGALASSNVPAMISAIGLQAKSKQFSLPMPLKRLVENSAGTPAHIQVAKSAVAQVLGPRCERLGAIIQQLL